VGKDEGGTTTVSEAVSATSAEIPRVQRIDSETIKQVRFSTSSSIILV